MRRPKFLFTVLIASFAILLASWWMVKTTPAAMAAQPAAIALSGGSSTDTPPKAATAPATAPGTVSYVATRGESIPLVAHRMVSKTSYLTTAELTAAIHATNPGHPGNTLKAGESIVIPGILNAPIVEKSLQVPREFEVRAV